MSSQLVSSDLIDRDDLENGDYFAVDIDGYEGPLHLLLDLARRQKVDLLKVSMLELANQYIGFIEDAREKRIDLAADYLLMAAWLAFMKSRLLLPKPEKAANDEIDGEDLYDGIWANFSLLHAPRAAFPLHLMALKRAIKPGGLLHLGMKLGEGEGRDGLGRDHFVYDIWPRHEPDSRSPPCIRALPYGICAPSHGPKGRHADT